MVIKFQCGFDFGGVKVCDLVLFDLCYVYQKQICICFVDQQ